MKIFEKMSLPSVSQAKTVKPGRAAFYSLGMALLFVVFAFAAAPASDESCAAPSNVTKIGQSSSSISYTWLGAQEATGYVVKYVRLSDGYQSQEQQIGQANHTFTGLSSGRHFFYFATICGQTVTEFVVTEDIISN
ncbi:MAG: hypothetical protein AAB316_22310 [Bacteroidota bacterium]